MILGGATATLIYAMWLTQSFRRKRKDSHVPLFGLQWMYSTSRKHRINGETSAESDFAEEKPQRLFRHVLSDNSRKPFVHLQRPTGNFVTPRILADVIYRFKFCKCVLFLR